MKSILAFCALISVCFAIKATGEVTTSGLSSGAFFAVQFHYAYSSTVKGCGVFAGGPFYCAQGSQNTAQMNCMSMPTSINLETIKTDIKNFETKKTIDPVSNLKGQKVFIFAGTKDTTVKPDVGVKGETLYKHYGADIKAVYDVAAVHT